MEFTIRTDRQSAHDITDDVASFARDANASAVLVSVLHTSCGLVINENTDGSVVKDLFSTLDRLVPRSAGYAHSDGNAHAHLKSMITGDRLAVPVENEELVLGTWQRIMLVEFDGPRTRKVHMHAL